MSDGYLEPGPEAWEGVAEYERELLGYGYLPDSLRGDNPCSRCETRNIPVWFTDNTFWNAVIRQPPWPIGGDSEANPEGLLCINCFIVLADERGFRPTGWRLLPEWHWERHDEHEENHQ